MDHDVIYNGSVDCKFVRKRGRVKLGMQNACLHSLQNLVSYLAFLPAFVCSASPLLPGRSFVLFRSVNVVARYSLTVEQGSMLRLGFSERICSLMVASDVCSLVRWISEERLVFLTVKSAL